MNALKKYHNTNLFLIDVMTLKILNQHIVLSINETQLNTNDKSSYF